MSFVRLKRLLYGFSFFDEFILIYPLYAVMFADKGLGAAQISSLFIVWSVTAFVLEIPSGSVADKYSRKNILLGAVFLKALAFACWLIFPNYLGFMAGFILWGVNTAFTSGTTEALVYDELKRLDKTKAYAKVTGRMDSLELLGMTVAAFAAALLAHQGYTLILLLSILAVLVSSTLIALLPRAKPVVKTEDNRYLSYLIDGVKLVLQKPKVFLIIGFAAVITGLSAIDEYTGLLFREQGLSNTLIAFWTGAICLSAAFGGAVAYKFENRASWLPGMVLILAITLFATALLPGALSPLTFCVFFFLFYVVKVLLGTYLQHEINDRTRATTTSVGGFMSEIFALSTFGVFALTASTGSYIPGFQITAGLIFVAGVLYLILNKRSVIGRTT